MSTKEWYVANDAGEHTGPYTAKQLKKLAESNQLHPETLIWSEGMEEWVEAQHFSGFRQLFSNQPQMQEHELAALCSQMLHDHEHTIPGNREDTQIEFDTITASRDTNGWRDAERLAYEEEQALIAKKERDRFETEVVGVLRADINLLKREVADLRARVSETHAVHTYSSSGPIRSSSKEPWPSSQLFAWRLVALLIPIVGIVVGVAAMFHEKRRDQGLSVILCAVLSFVAVLLLL